MTALYLIIHGCLSFYADSTCQHSVLLTSDRFAAHRCTIEVTRVRRDFLAHRAAGYLMAMKDHEGRDITVIGAACSHTPACQQEACS